MNETTLPVEPARHALAAGLLGGCAMAAVQTGVAGLAGNDSYYHLKMARLLPEVGYLQSFPWLHWTIFRERFVSHHHGFHTILAPLAALSERLTGNPVWGAKTLLCMGLAASAALFWLILRERRLGNRMLWTLMLCMLPWHFWLRMSYLRAPVVALPLLLLATWLVIRRGPVALAITAFVFAQVYGGVVLMPLVPAAFLVGALLAREPIRPALNCLVGGTLGVTAGLLFNPYFPDNLAFLYTQLFETGLGAARDVGNEWRPFGTWYLFQQSLPLFVVYGASLIRRLRQARRADAVELGLLLLNVAFFVLTLKARRFVEYWPVFALLNAADMARWPAPEPSTHATPHAWWRRGTVLRTALTLLVGAVAVLTLRHTRAELKVKHDHGAIREAMAFLRENAPPGVLVFTDDWDVFPVLFYYSHAARYVVGLDPQFTRSRYPVLWERYKRITRVEVPSRLPDDLPGDGLREVTLDDIGDVFGAQYVFVANDHPKFYHALCARPDRFQRVFPPTAQRNMQQAAPSQEQPPVALFRVLPFD